MHAEAEVLKAFKRRVDAILTNYLDSEGAPGRIAEAAPGTGHMGQNFAEVTALHGAYNAVHERLKTLSQLFADQIEALGTAVLGAGVGYENVDAGLRDRLLAIQRRTQELYNPAVDPHPKPVVEPRGTAHETQGAHGSDRSSEGSI
ncbi:hypothetical protein LKL35_27625 [Streptomyces sp. ET3-23]|uniref:hypothetical protein n=1 Tax=Streptomyces sp. ET3-23 TaxID=2885643 RepID=UPI001D11A712|nr:hypothetical protein [Streptomyces sp. ET3-23]MCC2279169.1 hypothetical protein [Streptomyces sp. ET3-23]